jgi:uncharacterized membrane protein (UPF0136 family)
MSFAPIYFAVFGLLTGVGGAVGFLKAKSRASLIAGGVSGLLLLVAAWLMQSGQTLPGCALGGLLSLALLGRFGPAFAKQKKFMPAGLIAVLAFGGLGVNLRVLLAR